MDLQQLISAVKHRRLKGSVTSTNTDEIEIDEYPVIEFDSDYAEVDDCEDDCEDGPTNDILPYALDNRISEEYAEIATDSKNKVLAHHFADLVYEKYGVYLRIPCADLETTILFILRNRNTLHSIITTLCAKYILTLAEQDSKVPFTQSIYKILKEFINDHESICKNMTSEFVIDQLKGMQIKPLDAKIILIELFDLNQPINLCKLFHTLNVLDDSIAVPEIVAKVFKYASKK